METLHVARSSGEAEASPDPSWRGLYQAGSVSAALFVGLVISGLGAYLWMVEYRHHHFQTRQM